MNMEGLSVLEVGCGHALPGIYALLNKAGEVILTDLNWDVIEGVTSKNVLRNTRADLSLLARVRFYSGDWLNVTNTLNKTFDLILSAETLVINLF